MPAPGNSYRDGYDIVMQFENVLNLPARAKVTLDGRVVGVVSGVSASGQLVNVTARIDPAVQVPADIHAVLQQATVLGDIYVALERPQDGGPPAAALIPGATLPLAQTTSPPQLEDTIARLADFVGSGSIQRIQNTIIGLNRVVPPSDDLRRLVAQFAADISDLADNVDTVDTLLDSVSATSHVLSYRMPSVQYWFSEEGMRGFDRGMQNAGLIGKTLPSVGSIYSGGFWLVPLLDSLGNALEAIRDAKWAFEEEVPQWRKLFTDFYLPQEKYPALNITSIQGPDGRELSENVADVLRILGGIP
ncbi:MCE family protein [Mycolicibacterium pulveris]|nr:MlaD family protein [Mycolicibacterium pulveris]MCV6983544.1 MCE family protein [Mycolicibacterium pulveris]